jgi:hypothetical protein
MFNMWNSGSLQTKAKVTVASGTIYNALFSDHIILCNPTTSSITVNLPNVITTPGYDGLRYNIKDIANNAATAIIKIIATGSGTTINGPNITPPYNNTGTTLTINVNSGGVDLIYDAASNVWYILSLVR